MKVGRVINDSHLFDGVDDRQIAEALHYSADIATTKLGSQYSVTMNSDDVPKQFPPGIAPLVAHMTSE